MSPHPDSSVVAGDRIPFQDRGEVETTRLGGSSISFRHFWEGGKYQNTRNVSSLSHWLESPLGCLFLTGRQTLAKQILTRSELCSVAGGNTIGSQIVYETRRR